MSMNDFERSSRPKLFVVFITIWCVMAGPPVAAANNPHVLSAVPAAQIANANLAGVKLAAPSPALVKQLGGSIPAATTANQWLLKRDLDSAIVQSGSVKAVV